MNNQELSAYLDKCNHTALVSDLDENVYRAHDAISKSDLWKLNDSPIHFLQKTPETEAMAFGKAVHTAILQPERYGSDVVVSPKFDMRKKDDKAASAAFKLSNSGKTVISCDDDEMVKGIVTAFGAIPKASAILSNGKAELSAFAVIGGVRVKARFDFLMSKAPVILDIKTTRSSNKKDFQRQCEDFGYYVQGAFYADIAEAVTGKAHGFGLIPIEKEPPFLWSIYQLDQAFIEIGRREYLALLDKHKNTIGAGNLVESLSPSNYLIHKN